MCILEKMLKITLEDIQSPQLEYLYNRGVTQNSIEEWNIGYLDSSQKLSSLPNNDLLFESKILANYNGEIFSYLNNYITFPFYNQYNKLIAFSGRTLDPEQKKRKYFHSSFPKKTFLFGLNKAIPKIRELDCVIVGEGQFDTIISHQFGIKNVCSTSGTALTEEQIAILARYCSRIIISFDADQAGQKAMQKLLKRKKEGGVEIIPLIIPSAGDDLDSFLRKFGANQFNDLIKNSLQKDKKNIDLDNLIFDF